MVGLRELPMVLGGQLEVDHMECQWCRVDAPAKSCGACAYWYECPYDRGVVNGDCALIRIVCSFDACRVNFFNLHFDWSTWTANGFGSTPLPHLLVIVLIGIGSLAIVVLIMVVVR